MVHTWENLALGGSVARQLVRDQHAWHILAAFQQLSEELEGGSFASPALNQYVEHGAVVIDRSPQIIPLPVDLEKDLVAVPFVAGLCTPMTQLIGELLAELEAPLSHHFIGHDDAARSQQFFDVTLAEAEAMIKPNRVSDNFLWKPKPFIGWSDGVCFHAESMTHLGTGAADSPRS
jgi:hypothetical protein